MFSNEKESKKEVISTYAVVQKKVEKEISQQKNIENINDLSVELLTYIFSFLDSKDMLKVALTCVLWNTISAQENSIWRQFIIRDFHIDPQITDFTRVGRKEYLALIGNNKKQKKKEILQNEIREHQAVLDAQQELIQSAVQHGEGVIPIIFSRRCAAITTGSTGAGIGTGFLLAPHITQFPVCVVVGFFGFLGCMGGTVGGSHYEQRRSEGIITNNQSQVEQIDTERTPLLPPKQMTMQ